MGRHRVRGPGCFPPLPPLPPEVAAAVEAAAEAEWQEAPMSRAEADAALKATKLCGFEDVLDVLAARSRKAR